MAYWYEYGGRYPDQHEINIYEALLDEKKLRQFQQEKAEAECLRRDD